MTEFSSNGTTITLKKSIRRQMFLMRLIEVLAQDETAYDHNERYQFASLAAFVDVIKSDSPIKWKPPKIDDSDKVIEKSYHAFMDADFDYTFFNELSSAVTAFRAPSASAEQKPDEALTEAEKADPNS